MVLSFVVVLSCHKKAGVDIYTGFFMRRILEKRKLAVSAMQINGIRPAPSPALTRVGDLSGACIGTDALCHRDGNGIYRDAFNVQAQYVGSST